MIVNKLPRKPLASFPDQTNFTKQNLWEIKVKSNHSLFWSYLIHFIFTFDGVKIKIGLFNPCNLISYLASPPASPPEMPWLAIIFLVIYQPMQVKLSWWVLITRFKAKSQFKLDWTWTKLELSLAIIVEIV